MKADLILVRHAAPEIYPAVPAPEWRLSAEGREAAARLAEALVPYAPAAIASSPEPKAHETAKILGAQFGVHPAIDPDLAEHRRPGTTFGSPEAFEARMRGFFGGKPDIFPGAEAQDDALFRFEAAIARSRARPLLVASHGTVLTLYLAPRLDADRFELWRSMSLPEAFVLDATGRLLCRHALRTAR